MEENKVEEGTFVADPQDDVKKAQNLIVQKDLEATQACRNEIDAVLKKYGRVLEAKMVVTSRGNAQEISVIKP